MADTRRKIGFLLLGGAHHILHLIPAAAALDKLTPFSARIFVRSAEEAQQCREVVSAVQAGLGGPDSDIDITVLSAPKLLSALSPKLASLLWNQKAFSQLAALVTAERTSTLLKRLPKKAPFLIHIPHGAGDRAKSYDKRIRFFDHVIAAGPKDKARMTALALAKPDSITVSGYQKTAALRLMKPQREALFKTDKPVIVYNPHFDKTLSSWPRFGPALLEAIAGQDRYNFIFAPHVRLFSNAGGQELAMLEAYNNLGHMHVDLGSARSMDMSYTEAADLYIGDVSSQVYEFITRPRPCLFLASPDMDWQNNPDFAHWHYGPVCVAPEDVLSAIEAALGSHAGYEQAQIEGRNGALGEADWKPIERAARQIAAAVEKNSA